MKGLHATALAALVMNELRLRTRRTGSLITLLVIVALTWLAVADPTSGRAMMVSGKQRIAYDSMTLAFGTALLAGMLLGLAGFYLARGRTQEDLRSGTAGLLGSAPLSNALLLFARWLGALAYLGVLVLGLLLASLVLHLLRGEGPLQPLVYLGTYIGMLLPLLMWVASMAVLADAWAPLMGKRGDLLYFLLWLAQGAFLPIVMESGVSRLQPWMALDIGGLSASILRMSQLLGLKHFSVGGSGFDASLATLPMPAGFWTLELAGLRLASAVLALLPLLPALWLFHRYSPDKLKARAARRGWLPLALLQRLLRPLNAPLAQLFSLAARLPGWPGQVLADAVLSLLAQPLALPLMLAAMVAGSVCPAAALPACLMACAAAWGVLISDIAARDHQAGATALGAAVPGGAGRRFLRQWLASLLLGLLFCGVIVQRWFTLAPVSALALLAGLVFLSACASLLGQLTRGGRSFLALFLFGLYLASQTAPIAWTDLLGFNGAATPATAAAYLGLGLAAALLGHQHSLRQAR